LWQSEQLGWAKKKLGIFALLVILAAIIGFGFSFLERYVREVNRDRQVKLKVKLEVEGQTPPRWASEELIRHVCLSTGIRLTDDFSRSGTQSWHRIRG
jgi:hypothetical protein